MFFNTRLSIEGAIVHLCWMAFLWMEERACMLIYVGLPQFSTIITGLRELEKIKIGQNENYFSPTVT